MIVLGVILILVGYLLPVPAIIATIGWILLVIGVVLLILGQVGRPVGGRRYWYWSVRPSSQGGQWFWFGLAGYSGGSDGGVVGCVGSRREADVGVQSWLEKTGQPGFADYGHP
jgi:hypothetical protein